jgi:2'-5' RNA ligase
VRLFVAIDVPEKVRDAIESDVVAPLRDHVPDARWTRPEGRHLTLKFLGNVVDDRVGGVSAAVASAAIGHQSFECALTVFGGFPNLGRPRVLWIGVGRGAAEAAALAGDVETALEPLGFAREGRPFRCHLTLARFREPRVVELPPVAVEAAGFVVEDVVLFESRLHPRGARYFAIERFPLSSP